MTHIMHRRFPHNPALLAVVLLASCVVAYLLPWVNSPGASLSFGAYDMAEWASLTPAVRTETPPLFTSLLLRLPLACIAVLFAASVAHARRPAIVWLGVFLVVSLAALQLPAFAFLTTGRQDPNYQQQLFLALLTLVLGLAALFVQRQRWWMLTVWGVGMLGASASLWGLLRAYDVMQSHALPITIGMGGPSLITLLLMFPYLMTKRYNNK
jgi:hypothetical protein